MDGHGGPERGDFLREATSRFASQSLDPLAEGLAGGLVESLHLLFIQPAGPFHRGEPSTMEDLVRVGVSDPGKETGVGHNQPPEAVSFPSRRTLHEPDRIARRRAFG